MEYDPFQRQAIEYINSGFSVLVSAPTGSGKTAIAEHVTNLCMKQGKRVIYTAPVKALSNQKYRDFQVLYKDKVGIITGDVNINPDAPIVIMTTEIFRNRLLDKENMPGEYSWIIFDEIHYIDDIERGTVWEESFIFMPEKMNFLALSATVPNIDELAGWIKSLSQRKIKIIKEATRPVPLHLYYQCENRFFDSLSRIPSSYHSKNKKSFYKKGRRMYQKRSKHPNRIDTLIKHLYKENRLPCIYFAFSRKRCQYLAEELNSFDFLDMHEKARVISLYDGLCAKFDLTGEKSAETLRGMIIRGIAYHHAGMLPTLKEVIERLFTSRLIKIIFTTETFALGINMPARTVVFDELRKFYGRAFANLKTRDFYQMAGRAGRRGIDTEGFVYSRINPTYISANDVKAIAKGEHEKVKSRFNASYATILNLYGQYKDSLYEIYPRSFHYYQARKKQHEKALLSIRSKVALLKHLSYIDRGDISPKGSFASKIYGYELMLTELHDSGTFETLSEAEIAILCVAAVFEPRKGSSMPPLSRKARKLNALTDNITKFVHSIERKYGITPFCKKYFYHLSPATEAWLNGSSFEDICRYTDTDEGELIRYFRMAIQIMREILDTRINSSLRLKIHSVLEKMNRDIINAENQLRITQ